MTDIEPGAGAHDRPDSVIACLVKVAEEHPNRLAVHDEVDAYTFAEVLAAAFGLADQAATLPPGRIGYMAPSRATTIVAKLGLAAAGRTIVPLDPTWPPEVLRNILEVTGAGSVIATPDLVPGAREVAGDRPVEPWTPDPTAVVPEVVPVFAPNDELVAYFTSGSTGGPKCVIHTQRNWVDAAMAMREAGLSRPGRHHLLMSPHAFAAAGIISSFALLGGSTLAIYDARAKGLSDLPGWIREQGVNTLVSIPSALRALMVANGDGPIGGIDHVIYGGEMITRDDVAAARAQGDAVTVTLLYISTELGLVTWRNLAPDQPVPSEEPVHAGWTDPRGPIEAIRLLDDERRECEPGDAGEIEVTARRLSWFEGQDRDLQDEDRMVLQTGDVGRLLPDGGLQIIGRTDQMVKIRGFRIDQLEVERQMRALDAVQDVSVVVGQTGRGAAHLVAHVVASDPLATPAGLRAQMQARVPAYMVPARVFLTDALPRLRNGKVDRVALRLAARPAATDQIAAIGRRPSTPTEKAVAEAMSVVLGVDAIGADDDFFDLGGSSLEVAELLVRLQDLLGVPVPASLLTHHTTPEQLAGAIEQRTGRRSTLAVIQGATGLARAPVHLVYDLHGSPFRLRSLAQALGPDQPVYGFECPLIYGEPGAPTTIEDIAAAHVRDLLQEQPDGPYHLCGYSVGAVLMYEIATQLIDAGREVGFAGAIDFGPVYLNGPMPRKDGPKPPGTHPLRSPVSAHGTDRVRFHLGQLAARSGFDRAAYLARLLRFGREYELGTARLDLLRHGQVRPELRASWAWYTLTNAAYAWEPKQADVDLTLFLSDQTAIGNIQVSRRVDHASRLDPHLGWDPFVGSVDVRPVIGYHNALVEEPYVGGVGAQVRAALDDGIGR